MSAKLGLRSEGQVEEHLRLLCFYGGLPQEKFPPYPLATSMESVELLERSTEMFWLLGAVWVGGVGCDSPLIVPYIEPSEEDPLLSVGIRGHSLF